MTKTEWVLIAVVLGLLAERVLLDHRLVSAMREVKNLQAALFEALEKSYKRVSHSHSMVMRVMNVVDKSLGIEHDPSAYETEDPEWPGLVIEKEEPDK